MKERTADYRLVLFLVWILFIVSLPGNSADQRHLFLPLLHMMTGETMEA